VIRVAAALAMLAVAAPAMARDSLGIFEGWGAFRDDRPLRCFAIAVPAARSAGARWRPFASVAHWPGRNVRGQLHVRMSRTRAADAAVTLTVGDRRFRLAAGGADAWAPDARADAAIVAVMRSATSMAIASRDADGRAFTDAYRLRGAATAIDAAALGCARRR
jgi:hypothetical protein